MRDAGYSIFKVFFNFTVFGAFGGMTSIFALPKPARDVIGAWLYRVHPYGDPVKVWDTKIGVIPSRYDLYASSFAFLCMLGMFAGFGIMALFFDGQRKAEADRKLEDPNNRSLATDIIIAIIAICFVSRLVQNLNPWLQIALMLCGYLGMKLTWLRYYPKGLPADAFKINKRRD